MQRAQGKVLARSALQRCKDLALDCSYMLHGSSSHQPASISRDTVSVATVEGLASPVSDDTSSQIDTRITASFSSADGSSGAPLDSSMTENYADPWLTQDYADPWLPWTWTEPMWSLLSPLELPDLAMETNASCPSTEEISSSGERQTAITLSNAGPDSCVRSADDGQNDISRTILVKVDPLEHHRQTIINYLTRNPSLRSRTIFLLDRNRFPWLLKIYFTRHHRHTPIIHLPTFNVVDCPTSLMWAVALIGASYFDSAGIRASDSLALAKLAYEFTLETDRGLLADGRISLHGLQALLLLSILDRLMVKSSGHDQTFCIDLPQIVRLARDARVFAEPEISAPSWNAWALRESRRRSV